MVTFCAILVLKKVLQIIIYACSCNFISFMFQNIKTVLTTKTPIVQQTKIYLLKKLFLNKWQFFGINMSIEYDRNRFCFTMRTSHNKAIHASKAIHEVPGIEMYLKNGQCLQINTFLQRIQNKNIDKSTVDCLFCCISVTFVFKTINFVSQHLLNVVNMLSKSPGRRHV